ncbi:hypothetical protein [Nocardioides terrisoli]|uniref:hypothetical protein n=1 Tax=Nocardioides terrisoli TaxID=3388267 RepID=UPI00287BAC6F|nr:hypothetical protein [Nocardioides marmorisolisilvae]
MIAGLTLVALVLLAATPARAGRRGALWLAAVSVLWLLVNGPMEGAVLWAPFATHGLTAGDLAGLAGLALAAARWRRSVPENPASDTSAPETKVPEPVEGP